MKKSLKIAIFSSAILLVLTSCDNPNNHPGKRSGENIGNTSSFRSSEEGDGNYPETKEKSSDQSSQNKEENSFTAKDDYSEGNITGKTESANTSKDSSSEKKYDEDITDQSKRKNHIPSGWIDREIQKKPSQTQVQLWENIIAAINKLIFARKVIYSPLGSKSTTLEKIAEGQYRASGHCLIIGNNEERVPYLFECSVRSNKYETTILKIKYTEPNL